MNVATLHHPQPAGLAVDGGGVADIEDRIRHRYLAMNHRAEDRRLAAHSASVPGVVMRAAGSASGRTLMSPGLPTVTALGIVDASPVAAVLTDHITLLFAPFRSFADD